VSIEGLIVDTWSHVHFVLGVSIIVRAPEIGSPYSFVAVLLALLDFVAHMFANSLNMLLPLEDLHSSLQCCLVLCHDSKQGVCRRTTDSNSTSEEVCFIRLIATVLFNGFLSLLGFPLCIKDAQDNAAKHTSTNDTQENDSILVYALLVTTVVIVRVAVIIGVAVGVWSVAIVMVMVMMVMGIPAIATIVIPTVAVVIVGGSL
jgi:hypothetical protein